MLQVSPKSRDKIESVNREKESLFIKTERGMLRIDPKRADIIRIRYTRRENFQDGTGAGICQDRTISGWYHEVTEREILLFTERLTLHVSRSDAAIQYADRDGKVLLSEREKDPRELEEFDTYRIMEGAETWTEDVETADGIKRKVHDAPKVFDKKLYHTRLHLRFKEKECLYGLGQAEEGVLNLRGTVQYLHQANRKIAVPFMISSEGYGLLWATGSPAAFQDTQYGSYFYTEADTEMDYYFMAGENFDRLISCYRSLTGKAALLPRWAYGYIQSQERYENRRRF